MRLRFFACVLALTIGARLVWATPPEVPYAFRNVVIGGGGFVTGMVFHPLERGLAYVRTDVGGAYRFDAAHRAWVPLLDWVGAAESNLYGIESLAIDPADPKWIFLAAGTYTNARAPNGEILRSFDRGMHWDRFPLPFKLGGNEDGRNNGERLAVDPHDGRILFLGTRSNGLWRSADRGETWHAVAGFPAVDETPDGFPPSSGGPRLAAQSVGVNAVRFDPRTGRTGAPTPVLYATVSTLGPSVYRSLDGGASWSALPGQPLGLRPTRFAIGTDGSLVVAYGKEAGPNVMTDGTVWRYDATAVDWKEITPEKPSGENHFGYGAVAVDPSNPRSIAVGTWSRHAPFDEIYRSTDAGVTWVPLLKSAKWDFGTFAYPRTITHHWLAFLEIDPFDSNHAAFPTGYGVWIAHDFKAADKNAPTTWKFEDQGLEETVVLTLVSPPGGAHLLSGLGDLDGFRHDDLSLSPAAGRFGTPPYKNTSSIAFAWEHPEILVRVGNTYNNDLVTGAYSKDGGSTWTLFRTEPPGTASANWRGMGTVALSPDAKIIVWTPIGVAPHYTLDWGATWTPCAGVTTNLAVVADTVDSRLFYGYDAEAGRLVVSRDGAATFAPTVSGLPIFKGRWGPGRGRVSAVPGRAGELWAVADGHLMKSVDAGVTLKTMPGVRASAVGFGRGKRDQDYPEMFLFGSIDGVEGVFKSDNAGETWTHLLDPNHHFGQVWTIAGDPRIFGRVYVGTFGRGIFYGDPAP